MRGDGPQVLIPESNKKEGVSYAWSDVGIELPAIDVTHHSFGIDLDEAALSAMTAEASRDMSQRERVPKILQRIVMASMYRRSIMVRHIARSRGRYLDGLGTYLLKLGVENLGRGFAGRIDRRLAASIVSVSARLRLRDSARLLADAAEEILAAQPALSERRLAGAIHFVNIGGGAAADSFNAVLLLHRDHPEVLAGRRVIIHVLDREGSAPLFGMRAVSALREPGAALSDVDVQYRSIPYDWNKATDLAGFLDALVPGPVLGSSEGGLFEYGSDQEIIENLEIFARHAPPDAVFVGTISRTDGEAGQINFATGAAVVRRELSDLDRLAGRAGWAVDRVIDCPLSRSVLLKRAG